MVSFIARPLRQLTAFRRSPGLLSAISKLAFQRPRPILVALFRYVDEHR